MKRINKDNVGKALIAALAIAFLLAKAAYDEVLKAAYDERTLVKEAYVEVVTTGYKCSVCGAEK